MQRNILLLVAISGAIAVSLGAFGAHGLKPYLDSHQLDMWNKAVHYQMFHTLAAFLCVLLPAHNRSKLPQYVSVAFLIGVLLFSGSLYLLATRHITHLPVAFLGPVTPIGGVSFISGWVMLFWYAFKYYSADSPKG